MEHLDTFLARHAPFDGLDPEDLRAIAGQALERRYRAGEAVLVEDGLPA
jgi:signal-transduction protein with cAMP-binding, CBS, and nucleotidyltransferase domain